MIFFAGALTGTVQQPEAANALIRFLASPEAAAVITKAGLMPLSERYARTIAARHRLTTGTGKQLERRQRPRLKAR